jgi:tight adherence protein B
LARRLYASIAGGVAGAFGLPNWYVNFKGKSRMKKFLLEFPNAIDVIVRGMKAGLPLNDCMLIIRAKPPNRCAASSNSLSNSSKWVSAQ